MTTRRFVAEGRYNITGRGTLWAGPCPFDWDTDSRLEAWAGEWEIEHPEIDKSKRYKVTGVESYCLQTIKKGSLVGITVKEIE